MSSISVSQGISTVGYPYSGSEDIDSLATVADLTSVKTVDNNLWSSWTNGAPAAFQSITALQPGKGYVVNAANATTIDTVSGLIDGNSVVDATGGITMVSFPYDARTIGDGYIPNFKFDSLKAISGGSWKSWAAGLAEGLQGFTATEIENGYIAEASEAYDTLVHVGNSSASGVRFNLSDTSLTNGDYTAGVNYTDPNGVGAISFDAVTYDISMVQLNSLLSMLVIHSKYGMKMVLLQLVHLLLVT
jgi:hypothetical protein